MVSLLFSSYYLVVENLALSIAYYYCEIRDTTPLYERLIFECFITISQLVVNVWSAI